MDHRIRNYIIKYICFIVTLIIDYCVLSCIAVKCKQWQLGDIYIHFRHFKVGSIDDIIFLSNYTLVSFCSIIRKQ